MENRQSIKKHKQQAGQKLPRVDVSRILEQEEKQDLSAYEEAAPERQPAAPEEESASLTEAEALAEESKAPEESAPEEGTDAAEEDYDPTQDDVYLLAQPRQKGFMSLVFSRFFIFVILMALQAVIWLAIIFWLDEHARPFAAFIWVFTVVMLIYLLMNEMDNSVKVTWIALFALVPIPAAVFLLYTQTNIGHRNLKARVEEVIGETKEQIEQPTYVLEALHDDGGNVDDLVRWLNRSGCFPAFGGTEATYYPVGEDMFKDMISELRAAKDYIFMEYFIIQGGYMWGKILDVLLEKAAAGVEVRVMYDGMCEISNLQPGYWKKLEKQGIKAKAFSPLTPVLSSHYNYRDHRKILVVDGKTAFTGGINLADEYINYIDRFGHWKDTGVRVKGDAAKSFALMFLQMWNIDEHEPLFNEYLDDGGYVSPYRSGCVIPFCDCPLDEDKVGETVYMDILNRAGDYVHIMTPYLILDGEMETALKYAAQRGVDVKIILPGIPDKKTAYALAKSHYHALTKAGVKIYEYTPGFVHAKVFISDDIKGVVGTINLDYRSLYHHYECAAFLYKTACLKDMEADFEATLAECRPVLPEEKESLRYRILGAVLKVMAPMM